MVFRQKKIIKCYISKQWCSKKKRFLINALYAKRPFLQEKMDTGSSPSCAINIQDSRYLWRSVDGMKVVQIIPKWLGIRILEEYSLIASLIFLGKYRDKIVFFHFTIIINCKKKKK